VAGHKTVVLAFIFFWRKELFPNRRYHLVVAGDDIPRRLAAPGVISGRIFSSKHLAADAPLSCASAITLCLCRRQPARKIGDRFRFERDKSARINIHRP